MIRLYGYWRSSSTWRVRLALALKAIPFELIPVNIAPGKSEQAREGFQEISPLRQVPVLELENGERLRQSMAIIDRLEGGREAFAARGYELTTLFTIRDFGVSPDT